MYNLVHSLGFQANHCVLNQTEIVLYSCMHTLVNKNKWDKILFE